MATQTAPPGQEPIALGGAIIKREWLQYYDAPPMSHEISRTLLSWDTAIKSGELNDYSVCTVWALTKDERILLLEVVRRRMEFPALKKAAIDLARRYPGCKVLIEDKSSGTSLLQELKHERITGLEPFKPDASGDKIMRLHGVTTHFEAGKVYLPRNAPWLDAFLTELLGIPGARHDDQVDSTTQALIYLSDTRNRSLAIWQKLGSK